MFISKAMKFISRTSLSPQSNCLYFVAPGFIWSELPGMANVSISYIAVILMFVVKLQQIVYVL